MFRPKEVDGNSLEFITGRETGRQIDEWTDGGMEGWTDRRMDRWKDGSMDT